MTPQEQNDETIFISGNEIPVITKVLPQETLRFFVENPRVYSVLRTDGAIEPSQDEIQAKLLEMEHVKELIQDIRRNGGLIDPIFVRDRTFEVLEGNSRLAAYRHLAKLNAIKWGQIKVRLLPENIDEKLVFALLGQYHLKGKTAWPPFEKAGFLYRRHMNHRVSVDQLAHEVGEPKQRITYMIKVYQFMVDHGQDENARWSYYDEYLKSRLINDVRNEEFDQLIVEKIESGEIERAVDVRDKLTVLCKAPKQLKKFKTGKCSFQEGYELAVEAGADSAPFAKLTRFRKWLASQETEKAFARTDGETRQKVKFELRKLAPLVQKNLDKLSK